MRYVIGVDGGQTSTIAVVADERGNLLGIGHGGPANHIHEPGGPDRVRKSLADAIRGAITMGDLENARFSVACLGMTGASEEMECLCAPIVPADQLIFGQDTLIALNSVTFGRPGAVVIAGTGAAAYGRNSAQETATAGGWGYIMGDEGSGYWIALRALNACCRANDGIAAETQILPLLLQRLETSDLRHVHRRIYSGALTRPEIAAIAEVVSMAAAQGDATARRLLREAGKELGLAVTAVLTRLKMVNDPVTVGTVGGVFRAGRLVLRPFREIVQRIAPQAAIIGARVPSSVGAALLALDELGVTADDALLANVNASLPRLGPIKS